MAQDSPAETSKLAKVRKRWSRLRYGALIITLFGLCLRLWGITWGLPNETRIFSYHPDEGVNLIGGVLEDGVPRPHVDLKFYHYGGLYFYAWQGANAINRAYGLVTQPVPGQPATRSADTPGAMILVGRLLTALLGASSIWLVFLSGTRLYGESAGVASAAVYAVLPAAVLHAHYATVDVPAAFMVTLALLFGAKMFTSLSWKSIAIAGFLCGLAGATKYNAILVLCAPPVILFLSRNKNRSQVISQFGILAASCAIGFVVGNFGMLVNPGGFWHDLTFELKKSGEGMGLLFADTANGWYYHLVSSLRFGITIPMLILAIGALALAIQRRTRQDIFLLLFLIPYYLVIGFSQVKFLRYIIPMLPVLSILIGRLLTEQFAKQIHVKSIRIIGIFASAIALFVTLTLIGTLTSPDSRDVAKDWVDKNVKPGSSIGFIGTPWYFSLPLSPLFTAPSPATRREAAQSIQHLRLVVPDGEWDPKILTEKPDYFAISEFETEDAVRIGLPAAKPFFELWKQDYLPHEFVNDPALFGLSLGHPKYVPNDWLYTFPRTTVYERRK